MVFRVTLCLKFWYPLSNSFLFCEGGGKAAAERFVAMQTAYEVLSDPQRRLRYDLDQRLQRRKEWRRKDKQRKGLLKTTTTDALSHKQLQDLTAASDNPSILDIRLGIRSRRKE